MSIELQKSKPCFWRGISKRFSRSFSIIQLNSSPVSPLLVPGDADCILWSSKWHIIFLEIEKKCSIVVDRESRPAQTRLGVVSAVAVGGRNASRCFLIGRERSKQARASPVKNHPLSRARHRPWWRQRRIALIERLHVSFPSSYVFDPPNPHQNWINQEKVHDLPCYLQRICSYYEATD